MDNSQIDSLYDNSKGDLPHEQSNDKAANCIDPLGLDSFESCNSLDHSENSDVWKGSDSSEDEKVKQKNDFVTETNNVNIPEKSLDEYVNNDNKSKTDSNENIDAIKLLNIEDNKDDSKTKSANNENSDEKTEVNNSKADTNEENTEIVETQKEEVENQDNGNANNSEENVEVAELTNEGKHEDDENANNSEENIKVAELTNEGKHEDDGNAKNSEENIKIPELSNENKDEADNERKNEDNGNFNTDTVQDEIEKDRDNVAEDPCNDNPNVCDVDMDDSLEDLDPSLLCPDISMDVDEDPVLTNSNAVPTDGSDSPLLYDPLFSTFVDEVTGAEVSFDLTPEELELKKKFYGDDRNRIENSRLHCTACNKHLGSALQGQTNRFVHPLLKVLICKDCYHFYTSGEFDKDEDGSELYCRWCGQGGQVLCCSKCEFVFCSKCIRNNFGRRKLSKIKGSEDWNCFRCDISQLKFLRVACAEFFEYVRKEMATATLDDPLYWSKDHTLCCLAKNVESNAGRMTEIKQKPKKKSAKHIDPDFIPIIDEDSIQSEQPFLTESTSSLTSLASLASLASTNAKPKQNEQVKTFPILLKTPTMIMNKSPMIIKNKPSMVINNGMPVVSNATYGSIQPVSGVLRVGNATFIQTPKTAKTPTSTTFVRAPIIQPSTTIGNVPQSVNLQPNVTTILQFTHHEWFEKTVLNAAKINSQLSYALSQLNKQQSQATTIEELAVVHNKLQEILSSSINSLINVRKNLRTDFISGIKKVKISPKAPVIYKKTIPKQKIIPKQKTIPKQKINDPLEITDDDVIFVSSPPPLVSLSSNPVPSTSKDGLTNDIGPRLKVRSFTDLQNVSTDCIIIPDDPEPVKTDSLLPNNKGNKDQKGEDVNNSSVNKASTQKNEDNVQSESTESGEETCSIEMNSNKFKESADYKTTKNIDSSGNEDKENKVIETNTLINNKIERKKDRSLDEGPKAKRRKIDEKCITINLKDPPTPELKKMLSVKVLLTKLNELNGH